MGLYSLPEAPSHRAERFTLKAMLGRVLERIALAERRCSLCGGLLDRKDQGYLCSDCLTLLRPSRPLTYSKLEFVSSYRVFGRYEGVLAEALKLIKFKSVKPLAFLLGAVLREDLERFSSEVNPHVLTYVPVHLIRWWVRGFDHNVEILKGAGLEFQDVLFRVKYAKPLALYGKEDRGRVVRGAFKVREEWVDLVEGKRFLVLDDVLTTGATATTVAELLMSLGAESVHFYFVASER